MVHDCTSSHQTTKYEEQKAYLGPAASTHKRLPLLFGINLSWTESVLGEFWKMCYFLKII
jgi:hypothetical protein